MSDRTTNLLAFLLLAAMFSFAFFSMKQDALTFDELAHISSGYSYLTQQDYRLNPEHPPLAKDIAAFPLLFLDLNFPLDNENWTQDTEAPPWWAQFNLGNAFLYHSGNDPTSIIFWSRLAMVLLMVALGAFLFFWTRKLLGNAGALAVLALYAFSPNFLAHGRLVTTDVAATFGILIAIYFWIEFLKQPTRTKICKAGFAVALALLLKFSAILLLPFFAIITLAYAFLHPSSSGRIQTAIRYTFLSVLIGIIALAVIVPVYQLHILNYPAERQVRDTISDLQPGGITAYEQATIWMADKPLLRPLAQFAHGVLMATQRGQFGNTVFFLGEIKAGGWWYYFPVIYFFKTPLAFHFLTLLGIFGVLWSIQKQWYRGIKEVFITWWLKKHFVFFAFSLFIAIYFFVAILGNLNIGVRHLLPTLPLIFILVVWGIKELLSHIQQTRLKHIALSIIGAFLLWYVGSSTMAFPHYISYYNSLAGGEEYGYKVAVDSNYDWGQDFYRLLEFVKEKKIEKLHLDYFGGEDPAYGLGKGYIRLNPNAEGFTPSQVKGWIAVSVNQLQGGLAKPAAGFDQPTGYYKWLSQYAPVARAGNSIFIYHIE